MPTLTPCPSSSSPSTIKTRILLLSDTHFTTPTHPILSPFPAADLLIHAGDLTLTGTHAQHVLASTFLRSHPAPLKLVVPGNHDVSLDVPFYLPKGEQGRPHMAGTEYPEDVRAIRELYTSPGARGDGVRLVGYEEGEEGEKSQGREGTQEFELANGAVVRVYASAWTPEFQGWAFAYEREEEGEGRFNGSDDGKGDGSKKGSVVPSWPDVDIMVTHGPPAGILDQLLPPSNAHVGCAALRRAVQRARPRVHVFGHIHEGWGAELWAWDRDQDQEEGDWGGGGKCVRRWGTGGGGEDVSDVESEEWVQRGARFVDLSCPANGGGEGAGGDGDGDGGGEGGIVHGKNTLFVNASIMDVDYRPVNAPWMVDLDLPRAAARSR